MNIFLKLSSFCFFCFMTASLSAGTLFTKDGRMFEQYEIKQVTHRGVQVFHSRGINWINPKQLPDDLAEQYIPIWKQKKAEHISENSPEKEKLKNEKWGEADEDKVIRVRVTGQGTSKAEALENALCNAVRKVVGVYVVSKRKTDDENLSKEIYLNADGVIIAHRELKETESNGILKLEIEADVVRSKLERYVRKTESSRITSTDIANVLNHRSALAAAEKSLEYIFHDYAQLIYTPQKIGNFTIDSDDNLHDDNILLKTHYIIHFNIKGYNLFTQKLKALLTRIAISENVQYRSLFAKEANARVSDCIYKFNRSKIAQTWPKDTRTVVFIDECFVRYKKHRRFHFFAIPGKIFLKMKTLLEDHQDRILFSFILKGKEKNILGITNARNPRFFDFTHFDRETCIFADSLFSDNSLKECFSQWTGDESFTFSRKQIENFKSCKLKYCTGIHSAYYNSLIREDQYAMRNLAYIPYIPAMLALAENFNQPEWYHHAAMMGSHQAQQKVSWKNSGIGIDFFAKNGITVYARNKGIPVEQGWHLKKIDGNPVHNIEELSSFIANLTPGKTVSLEFSNREIVQVTVL